MLVQIKFTSVGSNSAIGNFTSGDLARVNQALARHLVEEARVATYSTPLPLAAEPEALSQKASRKRKGRAA